MGKSLEPTGTLRRFIERRRAGAWTPVGSEAAVVPADTFPVTMTQADGESIKGVVRPNAQFSH